MMPAFRQQIFDVAKAQCEPEIEPDRLLDDLRREPVPAVADFLHPLGYRTASGTASPKRRDNASGRPCQPTRTRESRWPERPIGGKTATLRFDRHRRTRLPAVQSTRWPIAVPLDQQALREHVTKASMFMAANSMARFCLPWPKLCSR